MTQAEFMAWAKKTVLAYVKSNDKTAYSSALTEDDIFIVWYCKTLQNHKAILISCLRDDMIYEFTYNPAEMAALRHKICLTGASDYIHGRSWDDLDDVEDMGTWLQEIGKI